MLTALAAAPFTIGGRMFRMTASGGLVLLPAGEKAAVETLLADAIRPSTAPAKVDRGPFRTFSATDREVYEARPHLDGEIGQAVARHEFELHYQPQVRLADGALMGVEALLRWRHPMRDLLGPPFSGGAGKQPPCPQCRQLGHRRGLPPVAEWRRAGLCLHRRQPVR
ncbi:EAL domain-containing protein [Pseudoroseomonas wenyumeiae]|uniref:EAL domain-containing protein n=1 Tax=Teichococcus wenyumeiae TaxID=2478470 RepID=A0A3A9JI68_9PROT|nr:EAL domain-containing protein [Pseudoroseomonas wenyumeiae]RKK03386.1 EAL domain-containing protein [Pseudoroseomonas wenyumeiae]RMI17125.1 EAL domain-containing protein [Pseudoroseomonas wenyumeiae]